MQQINQTLMFERSRSNTSRFILFAALAVLLMGVFGPGSFVMAEDAPDFSEIVKWLRKSADQGLAPAQYNLGVMYAEGYGVPQDDAEAVKWSRKSADQGYAEAQFNLGVMYGNGRGVRQDYAEAMKWNRKSADQGYARLNAIWVRCMREAVACVKIMPRR